VIELESILTPGVLCFLFIVSNMLLAGLEVTRDELASAFKNRSLLTRLFVANFIVVPLLGLLVVTVSGIKNESAIGCLLMASAPGGILAIQFSGKVRSHLALATSTLFILSGVGLFVTPLVARLLIRVAHPVSWRYLELILVLGLVLVTPLLAGFGLQEKYPLVADRFKKPLVVLSNVAFLGYVVSIGALNKKALHLFKAEEIASFVVLILASVLVGWWAGGPSPGSRQVIAASTSLRNVAICLVIARAAMSGRGVEIAIVVYMALMIPINTAFLFYRRFRHRRESPPF
jgi:bile acid:Na+ symporter, BASS family